MARAPFQVLVIPFLRQASEEPLFCPLLRADAGYWQWVAGGGDVGETAWRAAQREAFEETGLTGHLFQLSTLSSIPVDGFAARHTWPAELYVIPEHCFAIEADFPGVTLSREHREYRWAPYTEAFDLLHWHQNRTALWELSERLKRDDLQLAVEAGK
ncbi:MAG: NUDIX domain-containing protein [Dehalococcoidia bacterium]